MYKNKLCNNHHNSGHRRGPSSFHMHDPKKVFKQLNLKQGMTFLDMGCGPGDYTIKASEYIESTGEIFAVDLNRIQIQELKKQADIFKLHNVNTMIADIREPLNLPSDCIDVCLLSTVLHAVDFNMYGKDILKEAHRVLREKGRVAIIECKKENSTFGPPINLRISVDELEMAAKVIGFRNFSYSDLGYNYLVQFEK